MHLRPGLNFKPFRSTYRLLRRNIVLLIAISPFDRDVRLAIALVLIDRSKLYVSPGFHLPSLHHHTYIIITGTYIITRTSFLSVDLHKNRYTSLYVMWFFQEVPESKIGHINAI